VLGKSAEERLEIGRHVGIGVFLHEQRRSRMTAPDGQQTSLDEVTR
jgi:hypothetical protein